MQTTWSKNHDDIIVKICSVECPQYTNSLNKGKIKAKNVKILQYLPVKVYKVAKKLFKGY